MFRLKVLLLATVPFLLSFPAVAANFAVGTCKPRLKSFTSISDAVSSVPPGSNIQVCPGVYSEQVTISQPLTLQGISDGGQDQIVITLPGSGSTNVISMFGQPVVAQVLVQSPGPVNISNITVDGTGGDQACLTTGTWLAGIFYASGSSGEVEQVRASGQIDENCGVGIWAENAGSSNRSVNIHNNSVHDVDMTGIFVGSGATPTLTATIRNNYVSAPAGSQGVMVQSANGSVSQNIVSDTVAGIFDFASGTRVSNNTVTNTTFGILMLLGGNAESNDIANSFYGIYIGFAGSVVQSNDITLASAVGIEFNCLSSTVSHNRINDAFFGMDQVPTGFRGSNTFSNTGFISTDGCAPAPLVAGAARLATKAATTSFGISSPEQMRSPANPFGARN
jgi:hypothetical protein